MGVKYATAINCIDGRTQLPVIRWIRKRFSVKYVDMINEPGVDRILAESADRRLIESIRRNVEISIEKHGSKYIAIVGHNDCAGNSVDRLTHFAQIRAAVKIIESWRYDARVIGLWIDEKWSVHEVTA